MPFLPNTTDAMGNWTENATQKTDADSHASSALPIEYEVALVLWKVIPPIIIGFGTFGNAMILVILRRMSLGGASHSMSVFFGALAVSDLLLLYTGLLRQWLNYVLSVDLRRSHTAVCKLHVFFVYLLGMTSAWFLVCMTLQRVMSVVWPHRVGLQCTRRKAWVTVVIVVIFLFGLDAHILFGFSVDSVGNSSAVYCSIHDHEGLNNYTALVYPWIDLLFTSFIPATCLFIGNTVLTTTVARSTRHARQLTAAPQHGTDRQNRARKKAASSLTATLMAVSVTYLVLTMPLSMLLVIVNNRGEVDDEAYWSAVEVAWAVNNLLWYSNSAINFYVYCLTGAKFRTECKKLLLCCLKDRSDSNASSANTSRIYVLSSAAGSQTKLDEEDTNVSDKF